MIRNGTLPLLAALICFIVFFTNVAMGAAKMGVFMGDVREMLMLLATAILFVIGILRREATSPKKTTNGQTSREETS